jgi:Ser/Thr protein kinase RdoA (MazF antagonist)
MKDFYQLTYHGRARRLRQMALLALKEYDLPVRRLRLLTNETNCIFRIDTESAEKYILRISDPLGSHSVEEIQSEMMWLTALHQDTDLGVPQPLHTRHGKMVVTVEIESVPEPRHCAIFSWVPGVDLVHRLSEKNLYTLGQVTAFLHNHANTFTPTGDFRVRKLDRVFPYSDPTFPHVEPIVLFDSQHHHLFSKDGYDRFRSAIRLVQEALDDLFSDPSEMRVTHNDLHQWNVRVHHGRLYVIDFEDLAWGYPVQDIATTFLYFQNHEQRDALITAYKAGYTSINSWPETYSGQIKTFIAGRDMMLANYLLCSQNPEDQAYAPEYIARVERGLEDYLSEN